MIIGIERTIYGNFFPCNVSTQLEMGPTETNIHTYIWNTRVRTLRSTQPILNGRNSARLSSSSTTVNLVHWTCILVAIQKISGAEARCRSELNIYIYTDTVSVCDTNHRESAG
jgi:hypothetical protein